MWRHGLSILLLLFGWRYLNRWYEYWNILDCTLFWIFFLLAIVLIVQPLCRSYARQLPRTRKAMLIVLLFCILPWGEWLHLNFPNSREDWSRQLFLQWVFLYGMHLLFSMLPVLFKIDQRCRAWLDAIASKRVSIWIPVALFFLLTGFISIYIDKRIPLTQDSAAHLFQANIFNHGQLAAPAPPVPELFTTTGDMLVIHDGKWFSMYLPGFAALLSFFMRLKVEWFLCPILGSLTLAIWVFYLNRWHNPRIALVFGVLFLFSPFLFLMSSTIMVHVPELFYITAIVCLLRSLTERTSFFQCSLLFVCLIAGVVTRGFSLIPFLIPVLIYACGQFILKKEWLIVVSIFLGIASGMILIGIFQMKTTGNAFLPAYLLEYPGLSFGFGSGYMGLVHTPALGLENVSNNLLGFNHWLNGWYSGSLVFIFLAILFIPAPDVWFRILIYSSLSLILFYFFTPTQDLVIGPRYYYPIVPVFLLVIAMLICEIKLPLATGALICFCCFLIFEFTGYVKRFDPSRTIAGYLKREIIATNHAKTLAFLDPKVPQEYINWNDPFLQRVVVLSRDIAGENEKLMAKFPDHNPVYFRLQIDFKKRTPRSGYQFFSEPDSNPPGFINFFALTMALQSARDNPDRDLFDECYENFFTSPNSRQEEQWIRTQPLFADPSASYKENFQQGGLHAALFVLLPKVAYEKSHANWFSSFPVNDFRNEYRLSLLFLNASGEVGKEIAEQVRKVSRRIDKDGNGYLSDPEIKNYLTEKIKILTIGNSM